MNFKLKNLSMGELISFSMGIFITAPIVTLKISGAHISVFNILFIVFFAYMFWSNLLLIEKFKLGRTTTLFAIWFYMAFSSSLFGLIYFNGMLDWTNTVLGYMPIILSYFFLLIMLSLSKNKKKLIYSFFNGFLIGCILNIGWAVIEGIVFYSSGYSISNRIFAGYLSTLNVNRQFSSIIRDGGIRVAGFNRDPAHLGGIIPIVVFYSILTKKYYLIFFSMIALVFSQSTTALVSTTLILAINYKKMNIGITIRSYLKVLIITVALIISVYLLAVFSQEMVYFQGIQSNASAFAERVSSVYINAEDQGIRTLYHLYTPPAMLFNNLKVITGTGFGTASYPFVSSTEISSALGLTSILPYDPESTYVSYLFNVGVIGLIIYSLILFKNYKFFSERHDSNMNRLIFASLCGVIFSGLFYHYTLTAYQVIILIMSTVLMDLNKIEEKSIDNSD